MIHEKETGFKSFLTFASGMPVGFFDNPAPNHSDYDQDPSI